jgi:hypothetical protein
MSESAVFVFDEVLPMSPEWTVFTGTLSYLTEAEINAHNCLVSWSEWLIDCAELDPMPLTTTSCTDPFTIETVEAGMECNVCAQPFAYFPLLNRCHPTVKVYRCHHVFGANCLQAWMDTHIDNTDMLAYKWPSAVKPLADEFCYFFKDWRELGWCVDGIVKCREMMKWEERTYGKEKKKDGD